jgi:hypothetical protein
MLEGGEETIQEFYTSLGDLSEMVQFRHRFFKVDLVSLAGK